MDAPTGPVPVADASLTDATSGTTPPNPPVVFLHYDYVAARPWDPGSGNFAPDPAAIQRVVDAYRAHGITLVIDPRHTEIPYTDILFFAPRGVRTIIRNGFPCGVPVCFNFYDLRDQYFKPKGSQPWHYVIFGDRGWDQYGGFAVGGMAELPGYNSFVTVTRPHLTCFRGTTLDFCRERVSGTFMHELGHNLGLQHGGDEPANYKLNYVSVMNYQYQTGIGYTAPGDTAAFSTWWGLPPLSDDQRIVGLRLDYSGDVLPALDELHLDERVGVGGRANSTDVTWYYSCTATGCVSGYAHIAAGSLDWDNDGVIGTDVAADINWFEFYDPYNLHFTHQTGFDDWAHVHQFLRTPQYLAGTLRSVELVAEPPEPGGGLLPLR